jgi:hypothetical protein
MSDTALGSYWELYSHDADVGIARKVALLAPLICIKG